LEKYNATDGREPGRFFRQEMDENMEKRRFLTPRPDGVRTLKEAAGMSNEDELYVKNLIETAQSAPDVPETVVYTIQKDDGTVVQSEVVTADQLPFELNPAGAYPLVPLPKKRPMTRRDIRTKILQATYAVELGAGDPDEVFAELLSEDYRLLLENVEAQSDSHFYFNLFYKNLEMREQTMELIRPRLENWDLERIALVDRIVLQLGICELLYFEDIPVRVTINEYIELAKTFSTDRSGQFVNGLLDSIYHDLLVQGRVIKTGRGLTGARADELPFLQGRALAPGEPRPYIGRREYGQRDPDRGDYRRRDHDRPYDSRRPYNGERRYRQDYGSRPHGHYEPRPRNDYEPREYDSRQRGNFHHRQDSYPYQRPHPPHYDSRHRDPKYPSHNEPLPPETYDME
jgi:N utilization substance protein B